MKIISVTSELFNAHQQSNHPAFLKGNVSISNLNIY